MFIIINIRLQNHLGYFILFIYIRFSKIGFGYGERGSISKEQIPGVGAYYIPCKFDKYLKKI